MEDGSDDALEDRFWASLRPVKRRKSSQDAAEESLSFSQLQRHAQERRIRKLRIVCGRADRLTAFGASCDVNAFVRARELFGVSNINPKFQRNARLVARRKIIEQPFEFVRRPRHNCNSNVRALKFHPDGDLLLASASANGQLCIYEMNRVMEANSRRLNRARNLMLQKWKEKQLKETADDFEYSLTQIRKKPIMPSLQLDLNVSIHCLAWNPQKKAECIVAGPNSPAATVVNMQKRPETRWKLDSASRTGITEIAISQDGKKVFAGFRNGKVCCWDRRQTNSRSAWEMFVSPNNRSQINSVSMQNVNSIQVVPDDQIMYAASSNGFLVLWDLRRLSVPSFGARAEPALVDSWYFPHTGPISYTKLNSQTRGMQHPDGITSIRLERRAPRTHIYYRLHSGRVGLFDTFEKRSIFSFRSTTSMRHHHPKLDANLSSQDEGLPANVANMSHTTGSNGMDILSDGTICYTTNALFLQNPEQTSHTEVSLNYVPSALAVSERLSTFALAHSNVVKILTF